MGAIPYGAHDGVRSSQERFGVVNSASEISVVFVLRDQRESGFHPEFHAGML